MGEFALGVELREEHGKGVARKLRAAGRIPAVCYRRNAEPVPVSLDPKELDRLLRNASSGINTLIDLKVTGGGDFDGRQVLVKELQRDPISGAYLHADLYAVDLQQKIHVSVPINLEGTPIGVSLMASSKRLIWVLTWLLRARFTRLCFSFCLTLFLADNEWATLLLLLSTN